MKSLKNKKTTFLLALTIMIALLVQSFSIEQPQPKKLKNIKVFPATASFQEVDHA